MSEHIKEKLSTIQAEIAHSCQLSKRDAKDICLIAVSKKKTASDVYKAYKEGQKHFGENFLQEALDKKEELSELPITWHFIGHIQSNKTKKIAENFSWIHSVSSIKILRRLSDQAPKDKLLNIFLQVNIDNEESKSGFLLSDDLEKVIKEVMCFKNVRLHGLMCIPNASQDIKTRESRFKTLYEVQESLKLKVSKPLFYEDSIFLEHLSMGMSFDFTYAIPYGATHIRVGSSIFGAR